MKKVLIILLSAFCVILTGQATNAQVDSNLSKSQSKSLTNVFDNYFALKDALVKTDGGLASTKSKDLLTTLNAVKMENLNMDTHKVWMKTMKGLVSDATQISQTKEIDVQRERFITLSKNMYELIKVSKYDEPVYYQFCPMANNGKGANWLSKESTVKNPYYGSMMLNCGKVQETIK